MPLRMRLREGRTMRLPAGPALTVCMIAGCQSYERAPLDLHAHRTAIDARLLEGEPVAKFVERLRGSGRSAPDRFDLSDGLTRSEGEALALFYNPELRLLRMQAGVALASFENAGLWEDPVFGFNGAEILSPSSPFEFGLTLSVTIPISGRLGVERARAGAAYEAELRRIVDAEWSTRSEVQRRWAAWAGAQERAGMLRDIIVQVERIGSITDRLEEAGELSRVEGRLFRVELANQRAALAEAELLAAQARFELLGLMGLPPDAPIDLTPAIPSPTPREFEDGVERLIEANTTLAIRRAEHEVAEESLRLEIRKQYPDITIGSGYGSEDDDRLLFGLSMPVPILNANRAAIAEARARREVARAAAEAALERLVRELASAEAALVSTRAQQERYASEIIPMLDAQAQDIEQMVELGEVDLFLLLETVTRRLETKSRLLDLRLAESEAEITIDQLFGPNVGSEPAPVAVSSTSSQSPEEQRKSAASAAGGDR